MFVVLVWKRVTFKIMEITSDIFQRFSICYQIIINVQALHIITSVIGKIELFVTANGGTLSDNENPFIFYLECQSQ